jgi:hypothetical protein
MRMVRIRQTAITSAHPTMTWRRIRRAARIARLVSARESDGGSPTGWWSAADSGAVDSDASWGGASGAGAAPAAAAPAAAVSAAAGVIGGAGYSGGEEVALPLLSGVVRALISS